VHANDPFYRWWPQPDAAGNEARPLEWDIGEPQRREDAVRSYHSTGLLLGPIRAPLLRALDCQGDSKDERILDTARINVYKHMRCEVIFALALPS
jgi:hypothetical protein